MLSKQLVLSGSTISVDGTSVGATYDIPLGNPALYITELIGFFTISGTTPLSSSLTITSSSTPSAPIRFTFLSRANIDLNGNSITIFGQSLTQYQASNPFVLDAWWDGSTWATSLGQIEIKPTGVTNAQLSTMPTHTIKMNSGATSLVPQDVTYAQFRTSLNLAKDVCHFLVSYNSGRVPARYNAVIPFDGTVERVSWSVNTPIGGVDDADLDVSIGSSFGGGTTSIDGFPITIPAGSSTNTVGTINPTTDNTMGNAPNNYIVIEANKVTWGGEILVSVVINRS